MESYPESILRGSWCSKCETNKKNYKYSIFDLKNISVAKGGDCLSSEYKGLNSKYIFKCNQGHKWFEKGSKILKKGNWCPDCSGKIRWNIQKIKSFAQKKGGDCLSSEWNGWHKKLLWVCSKGHKWEQTPSNIISGGTWCGTCWGKNPQIDQIKKLANERGGECLSPVYLKYNRPMKWICSNGHIFSKGWSTVKGGQWCPQCKEGISERMCRIFLKLFLERNFKEYAHLG